MLKKDVKVGKRYMAKVSDRIVPVYIASVNPRGGWDAINSITKRDVRIKSAARLRGLAPNQDGCL